MQASVPELMDLSSEDKATFDLYGEAAERQAHLPCCHNAGVWQRGFAISRFFIGLGYMDVCPLTDQCRDVDQGCAA